MKGKSKLIFGILGILISIVAVSYLIMSFNLKKVASDLAKVPLQYLLVLPIIYMTSHWIRGLRWKLMLNQSGTTRALAFKAVLLGFAGNNVLPARGGELVRMQYFSKRTSSSRLTAISSILFEKIIDGLILIGLLWVVLLYYSDLFMGNKMVKTVTITASIVFFSGFAFLIFLRNYKPKLLIWLSNRFGAEHRIILKLEQILTKIFEAIAFVKLDSKTASVFFYSLMVWLIEGMVFVLAFAALGIEVNYIWGGLFTMCILNFGILIPSSPGYIGVFQGLILLSLGFLGIEGEQPLSAAILIHASQFLPVTLIGLIIFMTESVKLTSKTQQHEN